MCEQLAERAVVRMHGAAALLRVIFDVDLRRAGRIRDEAGIGHDRERGHRHLHDGDTGQQDANQDGTSVHGHGIYTSRPSAALRVP